MLKIILLRFYVEIILLLSLKPLLAGSAKRFGFGEMISMANQAA